MFRPEQMILEGIAAESPVLIDEIDLLTERDREIIAAANQTRVEYPREKTLTQLFEEQVESSADRVAVVCEDKSLTYGELNAHSNRLARVLRERGVKADSIVGLMLERSLEMIIGVFGILKAGGAYLPIAPDYPRERRQYMLEDSGAPLLLTCSRHLGQVEFGGTIIDLEDQRLYEGEGTNLEGVNSSRDLAYVIYTSGSTGKPKGVMIEHYSVVNRIIWQQKKYPIGADDVILQKGSFTFDASVWELFWWAIEGAQVCVLAPEGEKEPAALVAAVAKNQATVMHFVPSMLNAFLEYLAGNESEVARLSSLRHVLVGGEVLHLRQVQEFNRMLYQRHGTSLHNLYGPTEATIDVSYFDCSGGEELAVVPIGKPIDNINLYIVDRENHQQPVGLAGELCISGEGLARGYLNRPELTAEKFVPNPFQPGERMYRTGDLARWRADGNIEYLGRLDNQVKIRGFRIELEEIESHLRNHEAITEAVAIAREEDRGDKYLYAYYVSPREVASTELREYLSEHLPAYMIPSYFMRLERLPLTTSGKVDRKNLPAIDFHTRQQLLPDYVAPRTEMEKRLAAVWSEVLKVEKVGLEDNFFELGGHSLTAIQMLARVRAQMAVELRVKDIFERPVLGELARYIEELLSAGAVKPGEDITPLPKQQEYELSNAQKRLWFLYKFEPESTFYNVPQRLLIKGELNLPAFEAALQYLIQRHGSLRTIFTEHNGIPRQVSLERLEFKLEFHDLTGCLGKQEALAQMINDDQQQPFDLAAGPLLRAKLFRLEEQEHCFYLNIHHIVFDGWSHDIFFREFGEVYAAIVKSRIPELKPLPFQYVDYAAWQNRQLEEQLLAQQEEYWLQILAKPLPVLELPLDFPRPKRQTFQGDLYAFKIDPELADQLKRLAQERNVTLFMLLLSAYFVLLHRLTQEDDIIVGIPTSGRPLEALEALVGFFVNSVAIRIRFDRPAVFMRLLEQVKQRCLEALQNQDYPFDLLVEKVNPERDMSRSPLFSTMFVMQDFPDLAEFSQLRIEALENIHTTSKFEVTMRAMAGDGETEFAVGYNTGLFHRTTIAQIAQSYRMILEGIAAKPSMRIDEIDLLTERDREIIAAANQTRVEYPREKTLTQLFEEQVESSADRVAVVCEDKSLTYGELNAHSNRLARVLREKGVKADSIVGLMLERSLEMIIGVFGILKAGGAYLPIAPDYPRERIQYMLGDSGAPLLLTCSRHLGQVEFGGTIIDLEDPRLYEGEGTNLEGVNNSRDLAYVIYTSGSTGKPKGVMIEHYSVVNRIIWQQKKYPIGADDVILQKVPFTFDVSVWELFWWAIAGAQVCVLAPGGEKEPAALVAAVEKNQATVMHFVPSMLNAFLEYLAGNESELTRLSSLRHALVSGEVLHLRQVQEFNRMLYQRHGTSLHNLYGPTEATVDVSYFDCSGGEELAVVPIGKPIDNINLYIVDRENHRQPVGLAGELCIAGEGLARGYLNRPELTAEKFVPNPFQPGERMYRTGDLARWRADGNIEYLGRLDNQVKIRGFRIELEEIESHLRNHEAITEAVAIAREEDRGDKYLYAYYVSPREVAGMELREYLSEHLPAYMIPSHFMRLERLPLTTSGKVDRKNLPAIDFHTRQQLLPDYVVPRTETEKRLAAVWSEVLKVEKVGLEDNFFELGGHSLTAIQMLARVRATMAVELKVRQIFESPVLEELAGYIDALRQQEPEGARTEAEYVEPRNEIETKLGEIWRKVSGAERVGIDDNFFEFTDDSLKTVILTSMIQQEFGMEMPLRKVFEIPTIRQLAQYILAAEEDLYSTIPPAEKREHYPLSSAQKRLFVLEQSGDMGTSYNVRRAMLIEGRLHKKRFEDAFGELIKRHESLRTSFEVVEGEPVQCIHENVEFKIRQLEANENELEKVIKRFTRRFDVSQAPLLRAALVKLPKNRHALLIDIHHIISDGESINILLKELIDLYEQNELPGTAVQYKDYAAWQNRLLRSSLMQRQEKYWLNKLVNFTYTEIPKSKTTTRKEAPGARRRVLLDRRMADEVEVYCKKNNITKFIFLLAVFKIIILKEIDQNDILIGTPISGRNHEELGNSVGCFLNILLIRSNLQNDATFKEYLHSLKETVVEAYDNRDYPYDELFSKIKDLHGYKGDSLFSILVNYLTPQRRNETHTQGLRLQAYAIKQANSTRFDMTLYLAERQHGLLIELLYNKSYDSYVMERIMNNFKIVIGIVLHNENVPIRNIDLSESGGLNRFSSDFTHLFDMQA